MNKDAYSLLRTAHQHTIVCIGDVMLDRFVYGEARRISPEAPVPVFSETGCKMMLGGAGNVARNMASYGSKVTLHAVVGNDSESEILNTLANDANVVAQLHRDPQRCTTAKTRFVAQGQQLLRSDKEVCCSIDNEIERLIFDAAAKHLEYASVVVLSDYLKGCLSSSLVEKVIASSEQRGIPVIVDPKGSDVSKYRGAMIVTPNEAEFKILSGQPCESNTAMTLAARKIIETQEIRNILITRGPRGMMLVTPLETYVFPTVAKQVFDVSGAGDSVVGALATSIACGLSIPDACYVANIAGGIAVEKSGTSVVQLDEILARVDKSAEEVPASCNEY